MSNENKDSITIENRFIWNSKQKDFVLYAGLLDLAHQKGLQKLEVELIQIPTSENNHIAICTATATSSEGEIYTDVGDANPSNVTSKVAPHIIRMASTRAKARCLRDFCNIGMVCVEELDEDALAGENDGFTKYPNNRLNGTSNGTHYTNGNHTSSSQPKSNGTAAMSEAQKRAIFNLAKRRKISDDELHQMIQHDYQLPMDQLNIQQASSLIQSLQNNN